LIFNQNVGFGLFVSQDETSFRSTLQESCNNYKGLVTIYKTVLVYKIIRMLGFFRELLDLRINIRLK